MERHLFEHAEMEQARISQSQTQPAGRRLARSKPEARQIWMEAFPSPFPELSILHDTN
jgi:hypothetical protein